MLQALHLAVYPVMLLVLLPLLLLANTDLTRNVDVFRDHEKTRKGAKQARRGRRSNKQCQRQYDNLFHIFPPFVVFPLFAVA
uniref:Putative secreted protein n=1 Tax=Anopheles darlingi TaxID=43151 RepID=A0A2M4DAU3_ANODA